MPLIGLLLAGGLTAGIVILVRGSGGGDSADGTKSSKDGYVDPKPLWDPAKDKGNPRHKAIDMAPVLRDFPLELTSVRDYAGALARA